MNGEMFKNIYKSFSCLEKQVTNNLIEAGVVTRSVKSNGLWCHILLPTILILYNILCDVSKVYKLTTYISVGIFIYSTLFIIFTSITKVFIRDNVFGGITVSSLISALLIYINLDYGIIISLLISLPTIFIYSYSLRVSLKNYPNTFTLGEAIIVIQGLILFIFMSVVKIFITKVNELGFIETTCLGFLFSVSMMVLLLSNLDETDKNINNLYYIIGGGAMLCLIILHMALGKAYLFNFFLYLFYDSVRVKIFSFWLCLLMIASIVVLINTSSGQKADTSTRKSFHVLGSLVFTTGILCDREYMTVCSALAFGLLIFIEALRKSGIKPFSPYLQSAFEVYGDEKDVGSFAMTPIYLFVGLSCPLLLVPEYKDNEIDLLSGVLSIGIGDTAASCLGKQFGLLKWPGSQRTIEGTIFNIASQIIVAYSLFASGVIMHTSTLMIKCTTAALVTGIVEARIDQVDNLILPLISILTCNFIHIFI